MKEIELRFGRALFLDGLFSAYYLDDAQADEQYRKLLVAWQGGESFHELVGESGQSVMVIRLDCLAAVHFKNLNERYEQNYIAQTVFLKRAAARSQRAVDDQIGGAGFRP